MKFNACSSLHGTRQASTRYCVLLLSSPSFGTLESAFATLFYSSGNSIFKKNYLEECTHHIVMCLSTPTVILSVNSISVMTYLSGQPLTRYEKTFEIILKNYITQNSKSSPKPDYNSISHQNLGHHAFCFIFAQVAIYLYA